MGPYTDAPVTPSGPSFFFRDNGIIPYGSNYFDLTVTGSASACEIGVLGTEMAPVAVPASGWSMGSLCEYGASAWSTLTVQANRTLTIEATALDEQGLVSENKLQPLIGVWNLSDPIGSLPTVASATTPFNSIAAGLTSLNFQPAQPGPLRVVVTDERGDGRPDYDFRERVLYADSISPALVGSGGGLVTITGMGFRPGLQVTVGGAPATVVASTANTILVIAPPFAALGSGATLTVDVGVNDLTSGGSTYMYAVLTYPEIALPAQSPTVTVLSPVFYIAAGQQVGLTPLAILSVNGAAEPNVSVNWSVVSGALDFPDGAQSISDTNGLATIAATAGPLQSATQAIGSACAPIGGRTPVCGNFTAMGVDPSLWTLAAFEGGSQSIVSTSILQPVVFQVTDGVGHPLIGAPVTVFQSITGYEVCPAHGACPIAATYETIRSTAVSDANGLIVVTPRQLPGIAEITTIAVSAGTRGFVSVSLQKTP